MVGTPLMVGTGVFHGSGAGLNMENVIIEPLREAETETIAELIRRNLSGYKEAGSVLAATFRRLENIFEVYRAEGSRFFVARDMEQGGVCIGGAGLGPLHGLPVSEGMGELRDIVLEERFRGRGIGTRLLKRCLDEAREIGYQRLYLETTPQMDKAQKLFVRFGFRAITQTRGGGDPSAVPSYYVLESP
jgi:putative acetyltransferase